MVSVASPQPPPDCGEISSVYQNHCKVLGVKPNSILLKDFCDGGSSFGAITNLDVSKNYLGEKGFHAFLEVVRQSQNLQTLSLANNGLTNDAVVALCRSVFNHPSLKSINLKNNPISLAGAAALVDLVRRSPKLTSITLDGTFIEDRSKLRIAKALDKNVRQMQKEKTNTTTGDHKEESAFQRTKREFNERKEAKLAAIAATTVDHPKEDISMQLRQRELRFPQRADNGWVLLNVFISATATDFATELNVIQEEIISQINAELRNRKIYIVPIAMYKNDMSPHSESNGSATLLVAERFYMIDLCSPLFIQLVGDKHGPVPNYLPSQLLSHPKLLTISDKEKLPLAVLEGYYGGVKAKFNAPLYFVREGARCLNPPEGIIGALTDDYSYLHTDPEAFLTEELQYGKRESPEAQSARWQTWKDMKQCILSQPEPLVLKKYWATFDTVTSQGHILLKQHDNFKEELTNRLREVIEFGYREKPEDIKCKKWTQVEPNQELYLSCFYNTNPLVGRKYILSKLELYVVSPSSRNMLLLHGPRCSGLTSTLHVFIQKALKKDVWDTCYSLIGNAKLEEESTDIRTVLLTLCRQLKSSPLPAHIENEINPRVIKEYWRATINEAAASLREGRLLVIVIDGIERLESLQPPPPDLLKTITAKNVIDVGTNQNDMFDWLPVCLPKNVRLIASCSTKEGTLSEVLYQSLVSRGQDSCEAVPVAQPGVSDIETLIQSRLSSCGIQVNQLLMEEIVSKPDIRSPLYAKLLVDKIIQRYESRQPPPLRLLIKNFPGTTTEMITSVLQHAEEIAGSKLVGKALSCLAIMKDGLLLLQVRELLGCQQQGVSLLSGRELVALLHGIKPLLKTLTYTNGSQLEELVDTPPEGVNGMACRLQILTEDITDLVKERYMSCENTTKAIRTDLARYLHKLSSKEDHPLAVAGLRNFPRVMTEVQMWPTIMRSVFGLSTVRRAFENSIGYVLFREMLRTYTFLHNTSNGGQEAVQSFSAEEVQGMLFGMKEYVHFICTNLSSLYTKPSLSIQQALQSSSDANVYHEAKRHFELNKDEKYFICINKNTMRMYRLAVTSSTFSKNGLRLLSSSDRTLVLCNVVGDVVHQITTSSPIQKAILSATSRYALVVLADKTMCLYDAVTGTSVSKLSGHTGKIRCCDMTARSRLVISAGDDSILRVWESETGKCIAVLSHNSFCASSSAYTAVASCAGHPTNENLIVSSIDRTIVVWKRDDSQSVPYSVLHKLQAHSQYPVRKVEWLGSGDFILSTVKKPAGGVTSQDDTPVKIFDSKTGDVRVRIHGTEHTGVNTIAVSPDERRLGAALEDGSIAFWDLTLKDGPLQDLHPVRVIKAFSKQALLISFSIQSESDLSSVLAVTVGDSNVMRVYNSSYDLIVEYVFHSSVHSLDCALVPTSEGAQIVVGDSQGRLYLLKGMRLTN